VTDVIDEILKLIDGGFKADPEVADWWKQIDEWRGRNSLAYRQSEHIMPQYVVESCTK
jgi:acetolactate synthase-1/2/3 large subunit